MRSMRSTKNVVIGVVVGIVCTACVLVIYRFTVGAKVSSQATGGPETSVRGETGVKAPVDSGGGATSHAVPVGDEEAVTKPAKDKRSQPPDTTTTGP